MRCKAGAQVAFIKLRGDGSQDNYIEDCCGRLGWSSQNANHAFDRLVNVSAPQHILEPWVD